MIPTKYKLIIREFKNDYHTSIALNLITPHDWWLNNKVKFFSLQYNFLRSSPYQNRRERRQFLAIPNEESPSFYIPKIPPIQRT